MTTYGVDRATGAGGSGTSSTTLLADGSTPLTADWDAGSFEIRARTLESDVATGTAPLTIASTTKVANLNADLLDDQTGSYYLDAANFTGTNWTDLTDAGATTLHKHDHGGQDGLTDDDHTQYVLLAGRATGQVITGGTASGDDLTLRSTSDATKGDVKIADEGGNVIVGGGATASELRFLEPSGSGTNYTGFKAAAQSASIDYTLPTADAAGVMHSNGSGTLSWSTIVDADIANDTITESKLAAGATLQLATMQASTSGTAINFTGIPSGTKELKMLLKGVSLNGTANLRVQLGESGGYTTSGYTGSNANTSGGATVLSGGGVDFDFGVAAATVSGTATFTLMDSATNLWVFVGVVGREDGTQATRIITGYVPLAGELDRVRAYTSNGTDTFDAGAINIAYK